MSDIDIDAVQGIRAWLDRYAQSTRRDVIYGVYGGDGSFELTISGLRALLALVDAQAARINKAREAVAGHGGENGAASGCPSCRVARALTEDVAQ